MNKDDGTKGRWRVGKETFDKLLKDNLIKFEKDENTPQLWQVYRIIPAGTKSETAFGTFLSGLGSASTGTLELKQIFGTKVFETVKPKGLIEWLIKLSNAETGDIILDSFAGSGTTAHAVLELNNQEKKGLNFILIEMEPNICKDITSTRIKKVIEGYSYGNTFVPGLGGSFQYCILDKPLFDKYGKVNADCTFEDLASYIYFTETKMILDKKIIAKNFIGEYLETKYYLIFGKVGKNTLTRSLLREFADASRKVIYGDNCTVSEDELAKYNATFKQIPYEVRIF